MDSREGISPTIRIVSGVLGVLGFAAIAFNALNEGGIKPSFILFTSFFAGFIFLFVAFFGKYPWERGNNNGTQD